MTSDDAARFAGDGVPPQLVQGGELLAMSATDFGTDTHSECLQPC